jgi:COP9 signalosome complex subunit 2
MIEDNDEDFDFEYEDDDDAEEPDVDLENKYYSAKGQRLGLACSGSNAHFPR